MQENIENTYIPISELVTFLAMGKATCINSILLDDFNEKVKILKENPEFSKILAPFDEKTTDVAIKLLTKNGTVGTCSHMDTIEVFLLYSQEEIEMQQKRMPEIDRMRYFSLLGTYRNTEVNLGKAPKTKGND